MRAQERGTRSRLSALRKLASPTNGVSDRLISREPISSLAQIRGKRVIDTTVLDNGRGYNHIRGNHMLYVLEAGLELKDVQWVEIADKMSSEFRVAQFHALKEGEGDVTFVTGDAQKYEQAGFSVLQLPRLPMINAVAFGSLISFESGPEMASASVLAPRHLPAFRHTVLTAPMMRT